MEGPSDVCGKPSGPCKIKPREKISFFCICLIDSFEDHVTIPCYVHENCNEFTSNIVTMQTNQWYDYTVEVGVMDLVTILHGNKWQQLVADHGLVRGDMLMFTFPKKDEIIFIIQCTNYKGRLKPRLDQTVTRFSTQMLTTSFNILSTRRSSSFPMMRKRNCATTLETVGLWQ